MKVIKNAIVVTRHVALVEYLKEIGLIDDSVTVLTHVNVDQVKGYNVIGVLPHSMSCLTESFTEVPLSLPPDLRGVELTVEQIRQYAGNPVTYKVGVV